MSEHLTKVKEKVKITFVDGSRCIFYIYRYSQDRLYDVFNDDKQFIVATSEATNFLLNKNDIATIELLEEKP